MKKIVLVIFLTIITLYTMSQSISVKYTNTTLTNGDSINVAGDYYSSIYCYLNISNNTLFDLNVKCKRTVLSVYNGTNNCYYWGLVNPNNLNNPNSVLIPALTVDSALFLGIFQYNNAGIGYQIIRYTFFVADNVNDSVSVTVKYDIMWDWTGINEYSKMNIKTFPNPTADFINFSNVVKDFRLYNAYGQLLLLDKDVQKVDLTSFSKGVYIAELDNRITKIVKQ